MARKKIVAGNWKMNKTPSEASLPLVAGELTVHDLLTLDLTDVGDETVDELLVVHLQ